MILTIVNKIQYLRRWPNAESKATGERTLHTLACLTMDYGEKMKRLILMIAIGLGSSAFGDTAPAASTRPLKVREIVGAIRTCLFSQAQRMVNQINGSSRVSVTPLWSLTNAARNDTSYELDRGDDNREINPTGIYVGDDLTLSGRWGECKNITYGEISVDSDDSLTVSYETADKDCSTDFKPALVTDKDIMPKLLYKAANRSKVFDRTGNERLADEVISSLQLVAGKASDPTKVQLLNSDSGHTTAVSFNADQYASCLKGKLF
jgi:hypothetical protein